MAFVIKVIADTNFIQGLLTAIVSAIVSGSFLLFSVHLTSKRSSEKVEHKIDEAKDEIVETAKVE